MKSLFIGLAILSLTNSTAQNDSIVVLTNINVLDIHTGKVNKNQSLHINGSKIATITSGKKIIPPEAKIIDGSGKFAIPGMIDTHIHFFQTGSLYTRPDAVDLRHIVPYADEIQFAKDMTTDNFKRYLRLGITSVMDIGGPFFNFKIRDSIAKAHLSPNVYVTGPLFSPFQPEAFSKLEDVPIAQITSKEEATALFNKMLPYKPDFIKIWYITREDFTAEKSYPIVKHISDLAHQNNLKLTVHATNLSTAKLAIKAGADILVHSVRDEIVDDEFINLLKKNNVTYIPTLIVSRNYGKSFLAKPDDHPQDLRFANPAVYRSLTDMNKLSDAAVPNRIRKLRKDSKPLEKMYQKADSVMLRNLKILTERNITIATGTDAGNIGTMHASSYIQEIEAMQKSGISNIDILKASTINAAKGFGLDHTIGSIEEGKLADLVILDKNPLINIQNLTTIHKIIKSGRILEPSELSKETPEQVVQRQVNAYNARAIDAFMDTYAENIKIYNFPDELLMDSKKVMRENYKTKFEKVTNLYCEIKNRIVLGNHVIDREYVRYENKYVSVIAIYEVTNGKISKVTFLR
ncbi:amidohydrolase family protein [Aquimarina sp. U1-2]|uniref:amidohydrolase family protein n=1 Tax=Aquimarina sp. U1-2 TaxID=2823141 RepID=UPI001AECCE14|nr:amidohydrolase family protein [Aquimarina sp. U1-2]MBP2833019.1 amidohydrolase family protein [Aquimarina sp. U1-2]